MEQAHIHTWKLNRNISTGMAVFLNQKRANVRSEFHVLFLLNESTIFPETTVLFLDESYTYFHPHFYDRNTSAPSFYRCCQILL